jgi:hypothetical protein
MPSTMRPQAQAAAPTWATFHGSTEDWEGCCKLTAAGDRGVRLLRRTPSLFEHGKISLNVGMTATILRNSDPGAKPSLQTHAKRLAASDRSVQL